MKKELRHVAIIMDGNGRWAKQQGKPRSFGHLQGTENVRSIAIRANDYNIEVLTLFAFSTENWVRPNDEVKYLMGLPKIFFSKYLKELMEKNIRITMIGNAEKIPKATLKILNDAIEETKHNTGMVLNFAMNYGSRDEIVQAVNRILQDDKIHAINESNFEQYLMTKDFPDVDLLIRTSGEERISNFLLWQIAYAELCFVAETWPEFTTACFDQALTVFEERNRRFGGVE